MNDNKCVTLKRLTRYNWQLIAPKGHILVDDLQFASQYRAELWAKAYISSFMGWNYIILDLTKGII